MIRKIFIGLGILIVLLLSAVVILPIVYKGKIIQTVKDEANKNLNAVVNFGEFDITLFKSFPDFSVTVNDLSVAGINEFKGDTLASIKTFSVTLDIMSVINGDKIRIRSVILGSPRIHAIVLKNGKANWDIAKSSGTKEKPQPSEPSKFNVKLKKFGIENGMVIYEDATMSLYTRLDGLNHTLEGDFTQDNFLMKTNTGIDGLTFSFGGVNYLVKAKTALKADLEMDMLHSKYTFKENELALNELNLGMDGWLAMPGNDINMDLKFNVKKSEFRNFISLVPGVYTKDFAGATTKGKLGFDGAFKGTYNAKSMPSFAINLLIENGMFKYPALPSALNNVQVNLKVSNPDGKPDHTLINLSRMHIELGAEPFDAKLIVKTPVSDPQIDASLKGKVNLANVAQIMPMEKGTKISGLIVSDLTAKGRMSSIEKKKYEEFNAAGVMSITGLNYSSPAMAQATVIKNMQLTFNPKNVTLNSFDGSIGRTDMQMSGSLDNFIAYALKNEVLKGTLNFSSRSIDLNEFMTPEAPGKPAATPDTATMTIFEVPSNIDFTLSAAIGKMLYEDIVLTNMKGSIIIKNEAINVSGLSMNLLDGNMVTSGLYSTRTPKKPIINFDLDISDFDVQKTAKTFSTVKKMAPVIENTYGKYSTKFNVKGDLDEHMQPVLNSLNGAGSLVTNGVSVNGFGPIKKVSESLKIKELEKLNVGNTDLSFEFANGRVTVKPFDIKSGKYKAKIGGSNGFDQTIDYTMNFEIPRSEFGGAANGVLNGLVSQAGSKGVNINVGDIVNVAVKVGGTVKDPKITTGLKESAGNAVNDLKAQLKDELNNKKKEAEEKARAEAERLKQEAEDKARGAADKARQEAEARAKAEADRIKKEAEDKAKAEAEKAKKEAAERAKKEAEKNLKNVFGKPK